MATNDTAAEIGQRIYARRKQLGMTQEQLCELAGTTPQAISNYERGERELKAGAVVKMAEALRVSCDWLLTGREESAAHPALAGLSPEKREIAEEIIDLCARLGSTQKGQL